jgi:translation initiation factor IF-3
MCVPCLQAEDEGVPSDPSQGAMRASLDVLELDQQTTPPLLKINPLAKWDYEQGNCI